MSLTPNEKDLLAKKSDLEGILKPDANDILHLPDITISLAENQQGYTTSGLSKDGLVFAGAGTITGITSSDGNSTTLAASQSAVSAKQDKLTAGTNITIQNNVISATGGGSSVTVTPIQNEGKQVATISVDGTSSTLYSGKTVYTGTTTPSASLGANDDLYIKYGGEGTTSFEDLTLTANTANQVPITNFSNYLTISFRLTSTNWSGYADVEEDIADIPTYPSTITVFEYNVFNNVALSKYDNGIYIHLNGGIPNTVTQFVGTYASYEPTNEYIKIENEWQEISIGGGGASALINLTDVDITTPTDGQGLVYNNSTQKWENNDISVSSLSDINLTNLANGQILKYDSANQQWINANESGGSSTLSGLSDVDITSPSAGQGLIYDATNQEWINGNVSTSSSIDTLTDVDLTNLSNGQILKYNSVSQKWENTNESGGGGDASPNITLLNDGTITDGQYVLSEPISNFDEINFIIQYSNEYINSKNYYPKDLLRLSSSSTDPYGVTNFLIEDYGQRYLYCQYIDETHIKPLEIFSVLKGIYGIKYKGGGGGGEAASLQATVLYNTPITTTGTYTLADDYTNYDFISIRPSYATNETDIVIYPVQDIINAMNNSLTITQPVTNSWFNFTMSSNSITIPAKTVGKIESIIGYKIVGGGGSASAEELTSVEYEALTPTEKENGTIYFVNDPIPKVKDPVQLIERVPATDSHITSSGHSAWGGVDWGAFDGVPASVSNINNAWCALENDATPWIQYHFDQPYYLTKLQMVIYQHYNSSSTSKTVTMNILGSNDGTNWENIAADGESKSITFLYRTKSTEEIELNSGYYEYIRIQGTEAFEIAYNYGCDFDEIYVYGGSELDSNKKIYYMNTCYLDTNPTPTSSISYSATEQEIGTWVDGSPLYQKTIYTSSMSNHSNIIIDSSLTTNNVDYFMGNELSYIVNNSYRGTGFQVEVGLTNNGVMLDNNNAPTSITSLSEIYTTVRYTKQTPKNITLLHFDNDLTDSCGTIWNVRNTAPVISTDQAKFGTSSLKFGGNGYIYSDVMTKFKFGTNDFTIDAWIYPTSTARQAFFSMAPINGGDYRMGVDMFLGSSANQWFSTTGSNWNPIGSDDSTGRGTIALSTGVWQHVALVRSGTKLITFIDGQIAKENTISASASVYWGGADTFRLGSWGVGGQNGDYLYSGYMDEFRVANYAVWTTAFTPPTEPYS